MAALMRHVSILLLLVSFLAACSAPPAPIATTAAPPGASPSADTALPAVVPTDTAQPNETAHPTTPAETSVSPLPPITLAAPPQAGGPQLAFLKDGDIWLLDDPAGQAYQLTLAGDIKSYAWSPDGERLAAFNGKSICFFQRDGSIRTACLELGLTDEQQQIERRIVWSPNQSWVVLWNPTNPWDEDSIGWLIMALDNSNAMWRIQDPVDWGAALAPNNEAGGSTGQPLFLADGRLVGTLTHRYLCPSGGCKYQLFEFKLDSLSPTFVPFPNKPEEGWSEGMNLLLSPDGKWLTNYGAFLFTCENYQTYIDRYLLDTGERETFNMENQAVSSLDFSPDQESAILARTAGCSRPDETTWSQQCGLSQGFEVFPMQLWVIGTEKPPESAPGIDPKYSPDGEWIAFNSCLSESDAGGWNADEASAPSIYLMGSGGKIVLVSEGSQPAWRPK